MTHLKIKSIRKAKRKERRGQLTVAILLNYLPGGFRRRVRSQVKLAMDTENWSYRRHRFYPWFGKIPWMRAWQCTPVFLPGESHGQRSLIGYSPWGCKDLDMTEAT